MIDWLRCLVGCHDWDEFGQCRRNWQHVQMYPGEMFVGAARLLRGEDWTDGPWSRVARRRREAQDEAGRALQARMAAYGADIPLVMAADVARDPAMTEALLSVARDRAAEPLERLIDRFTDGGDDDRADES